LLAEKFSLFAMLDYFAMSCHLCKLKFCFKIKEMRIELNEQIKQMCIHVLFAWLQITSYERPSPKFHEDECDI
jgi:hypothetical protein